MKNEKKSDFLSVYVGKDREIKRFYGKKVKSGLVFL